MTTRTDCRCACHRGFGVKHVVSCCHPDVLLPPIRLSASTADPEKYKDLHDPRHDHPPGYFERLEAENESLKAALQQKDEEFQQFREQYFLDLENRPYVKQLRADNKQKDERIKELEDLLSKVTL